MDQARLNADPFPSHQLRILPKRFTPIKGVITPDKMVLMPMTRIALGILHVRAERKSDVPRTRRRAAAVFSPARLSNILAKGMSLRGDATPSTPRAVTKIPER